MAERNIRRDEAAKLGREKFTDAPSVEQMIDQQGGHLRGESLGNMGNEELTPPLTEQSRRNDRKSSAATAQQPTQDSKREFNRDQDVDEDQPEPDASVRSPRTASETRPNHP